MCCARKKHTQREQEQEDEAYKKVEERKVTAIFGLLLQFSINFGATTIFQLRRAFSFFTQPSLATLSPHSHSAPPTPTPSHTPSLSLSASTSSPTFFFFLFFLMRLPLFSAHCSHHCSSIHLHHSSLTLFSSSARTNRWPRMDASPIFSCNRRKEKVIVIMGATGAGKSSLSIDLATRFPFSEIINSDKMQVYRGLDITTNKIPIDERNGVPHHLLGDVDPDNGEFTPLDFRLRAASVISDITSRGKFPIVVGGSNSFVHALLVDRFDPEINVFNGSLSSSSLISSELRYECCFLWVDVAFPLLSDYLMKRVDDMLELGMVEELAEFFDPDADDLEVDSDNRIGLRKAIGVPEFDRYFKRYQPPGGLSRECTSEEDRVRKSAYEEAVRAIKDNTCRLVRKQIGKILRLRESGWDLQRVDATEVFRAKLGKSGGERWSEIWEREVLLPSVKIVNSFLQE